MKDRSLTQAPTGRKHETKQKPKTYMQDVWPGCVRTHDHPPSPPLSTPPPHGSAVRRAADFTSEPCILQSWGTGNNEIRVLRPTNITQIIILDSDLFQLSYLLLLISNANVYFKANWKRIFLECVINFEKKKKKQQQKKKKKKKKKIWVNNIINFFQYGKISNACAIKQIGRSKMILPCWQITVHDLKCPSS